METKPYNLPDARLYREGAWYVDSDQNYWVWEKGEWVLKGKYSLLPRGEKVDVVDPRLVV